MRTKITFAMLVMASLTFYALYLHDDTAELKDPGSYSNLSSDNRPVYIAGCQNFHGPAPPRVIYPTVRKNFMSLTCALEVPLPYGVAVLQKMAAKQIPIDQN